MLSLIRKMFRSKSSHENILSEHDTEKACSFYISTEHFEVNYNTLTFLVVDDNVFLQDMTKKFLERLGITVDTANDGQRGLQMYLDAPDKYDMILMDIEMPIMGGFEAAKKIRASGLSSAKTILIVAVTGSMFYDDPRMPLFDNNIKKPFPMENLESLIKQTLWRQSSFMRP